MEGETTKEQEGSRKERKQMQEPDKEAQREREREVAAESRDTGGRWIPFSSSERLNKSGEKAIHYASPFLSNNSLQLTRAG